MEFGTTVTVTRIRSRPGVDRWGDKLPPKETAIPGCSLEPRTSTESPTAHEGVVTGLAIKVPQGWDVLHTDEFRIPPPWSDDLAVWQVEGEISTWVNPFTGWAPPPVVNVKRRTGGG